MSTVTSFICSIYSKAICMTDVSDFELKIDSDFNVDIQSSCWFTTCIRCETNITTNTVYKVSQHSDDDDDDDDEDIEDGHEKAAIAPLVSKKVETILTSPSVTLIKENKFIKKKDSAKKTPRSALCPATKRHIRDQRVLLSQRIVRRDRESEQRVVKYAIRYKRDIFADRGSLRAFGDNGMNPFLNFNASVASSSVDNQS
ncbi:hypothetical protein MBM_01452 [Drepanopeziza brunnea f. sp. 'multigermtubi' MB_m1]|uniref:Uncharacterized protein n=1 Tax=Marssonina brunnea f. sp. multigermtubi (strain MB_m1) TaxID=1072389 RepID=K1WSZ7_MARBU|nr:uncharacterized protein MBM_01452 [Drepanopeziza brunnea f. sp. 'multigermtubi' MB_m1]EKD20770.1 hypothetical protein MBM_01452 [Drepanopeziza brunnea f. sp. 'multigermtubi' MB_m1]